MNPINKQTQTINEFIAILKILGIETVVDVRIIAASGHNPQYNREILNEILTRKIEALKSPMK